ncbi:hypothetical protein U1Q18_052166 [Sarracenia purpurea var. burkii]
MLRMRPLRTLPLAVRKFNLRNASRENTAVDHRRHCPSSSDHLHVLKDDQLKACDQSSAVQGLTVCSSRARPRHWCQRDQGISERERDFMPHVQKQLTSLHRRKHGELRLFAANGHEKGLKWDCQGGLALPSAKGVCVLLQAKIRGDSQQKEHLRRNLFSEPCDLQCCSGMTPTDARRTPMLMLLRPLLALLDQFAWQFGPCLIKHVIDILVERVSSREASERFPTERWS